MNVNLDKIAKELYGKIQTRFDDIQFGDEEGTILSKKADIPKARFFEFEYKENGEVLGNIAITLDEEDGIIIQIADDLVDDDNSIHPKAYEFIKSFRKFAKNRLLNFDVQNIGKSELDKRDYEFQAKPKEENIMENKLFGTARMSYQDLGEARLVVKHSQPINPELAAGRTMHIDSIYIENAAGERFRYPHKHLSGARALAEHIKAGGNPYDAIGQHICRLSEELASLRKFKGYVSRQEQISEAMGNVTSRVIDRIEEIKETIAKLQKPAYYEQFAESFEAQEEQMIPEEIANDLIDRLTIRTFNEDLKSIFPYIYKFVDESELPVKELTPEDILGEADDEEGTPHSHQAKATLKHLKKASYGDKADAANIKPGTKGFKDRYDMLSRAEKEGNLKDSYNPNSVAAQHARDLKTHHRAELKKKAEAGDERAKAMLKHAEERDEARRQEFNDRMERESFTPESQFESFLDSIVEDGMDMGVDTDTGTDTLFSDDPDTSKNAIDTFNSEVLAAPVPAQTAIDTLKGYIDDPRFLDEFKDLDPNLDVRSMIQDYVQNRNADVGAQLNFGQEEVGGENLPAPEPAPEPAPAEVAPVAPEAGAVPPAAPATPPPAPLEEEKEEKDEKPPFDGPYTKVGDKKDEFGNPIKNVARHLAKKGMKDAISKAKKAGATLETKLDFGYGIKTLAEIIYECDCTPDEFGYDDQGPMDPNAEMEKYVQGFFDHEAGHFPLGAERIKIKVTKAAEDGEFGNVDPASVEQVLHKIEQMDGGSDEKNGILKLAGLLKQAHQEKHSDVPSFMENNSKVAYSEDPTLARLISLIGR